MKQITVREAANSDIESIYTVFSETELLHRNAYPQFFRQTKNSTPAMDYLLDSIHDPNAVIFLAERGGEVLGAIHCRIQNSTENPVLIPRKYALVENIAVAHSQRRSGVGKALMKRAEQWGKALGAKTIELTVWEFNQTAKEFYSQLDYQPIRQRMSKELR